MSPTESKENNMSDIRSSTEGVFQAGFIDHIMFTWCENCKHQLTLPVQTQKSTYMHQQIFWMVTHKSYQIGRSLPLNSLGKCGDESVYMEGGDGHFSKQHIQIYFVAHDIVV